MSRRWHSDPNAEGGLWWGDHEDPDGEVWDVGEAFVHFEVTPEVQESRDALVAMVEELEALRGIARRLREDWCPQADAMARWRWIRKRIRDWGYDIEVMTEAEARAIGVEPVTLSEGNDT
jgi:hypothetical protein